MAGAPSFQAPASVGFVVNFTVSPHLLQGYCWVMSFMGGSLFGFVST